MQRQVFWWNKNRLPQIKDLAELSGLDGVLIDTAGSDLELSKWQDRFAGRPEDIPFISFADVLLQRRAGEFPACALP